MSAPDARPLVLPDWLAQRAAGFPGEIAVSAGGEPLTFGGLDRRAAAAARRLAGLGAGPGTRVALLLRSGASFAVLTHALARLGAVMVPLNTRLAAAEIAWQVADARAGLLIADDALAPAAAEVGRRASGPRMVSLDELARAPEATAAPASGLDLSAPQGIVYTSATSGRPKGVVLTFGNHWWNAIGSALNLGLHRDDRWLVPLPLYHVGGLAVLWRSVIYGIPAIIHETFDPERVNREIDSGGVTLISVVGAMLRRMLDARGARPYPPRLRCVLLGGGPAPPGLIEACLERGVPVAPTYGLTEAASQVTTLLPAEVAGRPGCAGRALFPAEVRIEEEEILVRGPTVMAGYADRPEETAHALRGGWLHTGDLGRLDHDGYLYVLDRRDDLIVSGGENVYPAEVEAVLRAHPAVEDAGVFGVPDPDWGQRVAAAITLRTGASLHDGALQGFCAGRLARYKIPGRIWVVEALPRSPAGKLLRRELRGLAARLHEPGPA